MVHFNPRSLQKSVDVLDHIRTKYGDMESQGISILLHIMLNDPDPLTVAELRERVGISHGSTIRFLRLLGVEGNHPRGGVCAGLVRSDTDPADRRRKLVTLSQKGRILRVLLAPEV